MSDLKSLIETCRSSFLLWKEPHLGQIRVSGSEHLAFLGALCPLLINPKPGACSSVVFLDKKGTIQWGALLAHHHLNESFLVLPQEQIESLRVYLDNLVFGEDVQFSRMNFDVALNQGPSQTLYQSAYQFDFDLCGQGGQLLLGEFAEVVEYTELSNALSANGPPLPWNFTQILINETRLMQLPFQHKCYPGQEIVARIRDRGAPPRHSYWIETENLDHLREASKQIQILEQDPSQNRLWALVPTKLVNGSMIEIEGIKLAIIHRFRPFISIQKQSSAQQHYQEGLAAFHQNDLEAARFFFQKSIDANPYLSESWEAMGMILEKQKQWDLAIKAQLKFAELEPLSIMPLTNLSRLYMHRGLTDKAESYQAKAQALAHQLQSNNQLSEHEWAASQAQIDAMEQEKMRKKQLFMRALEMDPEDDIALFGLGKMLNDEQKFNDALPYLQSLVKLQPDYSAAWAQLSRAVSKTLPTDQAKSIIQQGLNCAQTQGALMPLKLMQSILSKL